MRRIDKWVALAALWVGSAHANDPVFRYEGPCDASAAVAISQNEFVVANDENSVLFAYRFGVPKAIRTFDLTRILGAKKNQEADIEGAAAIGSRIYWISSHSRNSNGKEQQSRYRLFATDLRSDGLVTVGKPYEHLLHDLIKSAPLAQLHLAAASKLAAEADGGLNIEGLAATPEGQLLIGFRNPLPGERAIIVPLENPGEITIDGKRAKLGEAFELNLGRRGIRGIEWVNGRYLIVAGPAADEGSFALYRWSGKRDDSAEPIAVELGSLRPEALFAVPNTAKVQLLSDDGGVVTAGVECKKVPAAKQTFRSLVVTP
jgi:Protein of unknown function (DUF3616)